MPRLQSAINQDHDFDLSIAHEYSKRNSMQYQIPKQPEQDVRKNINILTWKNYKLPTRGKMTFLDDVISHSKKKGNAGYRLGQTDWKEE